MISFQLFQEIHSQAFSLHQQINQRQLFTRTSLFSKKKCFSLWPTPPPALRPLCLLAAACTRNHGLSATLCNSQFYLVMQHKNDFPLYTEAIKFFNHSESMVRIAVRTLTLNVYRGKHLIKTNLLYSRPSPSKACSKISGYRQSRKLRKLWINNNLPFQIYNVLLSCCLNLITKADLPHPLTAGT